MIEKMKAVCVVTRACQKDSMLDTLRDMGILHVSEKKAADGVYLERFSVISRLLGELKAYVTEGEQPETLLTDEEFEKIYKETIDALDRKASVSTKRVELSLELEKLRPWGEFDSEEIRSLPKALNMHFYRVDKRAYRELAADESVKFVRLCNVDQMEAIAVVGALDGSVNAIPFNVPEKGPVQLREEIAECDRVLEKCETTLKSAAKHLKSYADQLTKAQNDAEYSSVDRTLGKDSDLIWLGGYIPSDEEEAFVRTAREQNWAWAINEIEDGDESVPTKIRYNKLTALIKPVFDILGVVPGYREYDISFWFLAFFALFFAMIIGDAGYGAIFLIGAVVLNIKSKKITNIVLLLYVLSCTTIIWGALTGTWFGLEGAMNIPFFKALVIPAIANYPEHFGVETVSAQNNVMRFCFSIGVIQLALACVMNITRKCREKSLGFLADIGWLMSISALYFLVLNLVIGQSIDFAIVASVIGGGFVMVILFGGMEAKQSFSKGLKAGLGNAFTVFLNTISAFGNIMSYIRLFAVGMASLAIAQSFNGMAEGFSGVLVIVGAIIMAVGHLLNIVMGFLSVVVHGVRLNLLEFSGQLGMEWSGVAYQPFKKIKNKNKQ